MARALTREEQEYEQQYPKGRYGRRHYRIHKDLGDYRVRLITMDGAGTIDVFRSEITVLSMVEKRRQNRRIRETVRKLLEDARA
jgi:hypothetical protein